MSATRALVLLAGAAFTHATAAAADLTIDRWELINTQYFENVSPAAAQGRKVYRFKRAAAVDAGAERCVREWRDSVARQTQLEAFCQALLADIAPQFRLVLRSGDAGAVVLEGVDVDVKRASVLKGGHGFFTDDAYYDLFIKAAAGLTSVSLRQPLRFTTLGSVDLRLGFDLSPLGPATPAAAIEFVLTFRVDGASGTTTAQTGVIRIEL
jgi:hypothetical protein